MTDIDAETLKREWSGALLKWWFLPPLAAVVAGAVTYPTASALNPVHYSAMTYVYMPPAEVGDFRQAMDALPDDIKGVPDSHGNQHLVLVAPTFSEARNRLVAARAALDAIAETSLAQPEAAASAEIVDWVQKFRSQSVSVSQLGGGGKPACLAIAWAFMLTLGGILFIRSRKYDSERSPSLV
jgi:hypothetical protein